MNRETIKELNRETIKESSDDDGADTPKTKPTTFKHKRGKKNKRKVVDEVKDYISDEDEEPRRKHLRKRPPETKRYPAFIYY